MAETKKDQSVEDEAKKKQEKKACIRFTCKVRCVYQGRRYKPGETLTTDAPDVPEYFTPVQ